MTSFLHKITKFTFCIFISAASTYAQDSTSYTSLGDFLRQGAVSGKTRTYYMYSDNRAPLSDYHGLGIGAGIGYQSPSYKGLSINMSGYFIVNTFSSDFTIPDSITQNPNRYELGLFDITDPGNKSNLYRLENLNITYSRKGNTLKVGQYIPDYSFINPQDGRMSPTVVRGVDFRKKWNNTAIGINYINGLSPRSTVKWYSVKETFGIYPTGRDTDGSASSYKGNIETSGIFQTNWNQKWSKYVNTSFQTMTVPSVFQTYLAEINLKQADYYVNSLFIYQHVLDNSQNLSYDQIDNKTGVYSLRLGKKTKNWNLNLNCTRIGKTGRFLMPREWGREPFYTFMPRERNEGTGDVNAFSFNVTRLLTKNLVLKAAYGRFYLPNATDAKLNKYAMPAYQQTNIEINYALSGWFSGADFKVLFVRKDELGTPIENPKLVFNKVDVSLLNMIFNYNF